MAESAQARLVGIGTTKPAKFEFAAVEISIGSAAGNDLVVVDATVSRRHARLTREGDNFLLTDLESTNGTYVNGKRIAEATTVRDGDEITFGTTRYVLRCSQAPSAADVSPVESAPVTVALKAEELAAIGSQQIKPAAGKAEPAEANASSSPSATVEQPQVSNSAADSGQKQQPRRDGNAGTRNKSRSRTPRTTIVVIIAFLFAASFGVTEYFINRESEVPVAAKSAGVAVPKPAATAAPASGASPSGITSPATEKTAGASAKESATPRPAVTRAHARPAYRPHHEASPAIPSAAEVSEWLEPLNHYRAMAHLAPVIADQTLSEADFAHARYLVKNYSALIKGPGLGIEAHRENPAKPWYSAAGASAAASSDVIEGWSRNKKWLTPAGAIRGWVSIPFHRLWILNPNLKRVGYGQFCEDGVCVGALNVLNGADPIPSSPTPLANPIEFPPNGAVIHLQSAGGEWPDPLTACAGYTPPGGLPITLQMGAHIDPRLSTYSLTKNGTFPAPIEACGFDAANYYNPDPVQQSRGRNVLANFGAIVIIPRGPLDPGNYTASIVTDGRRYEWSFTIVSP